MGFTVAMPCTDCWYEFHWSRTGHDILRTPSRHFEDTICCVYPVAFTTGALEGQHSRKTGKLVSLSEQNLVDCSTEYGNVGCRGGFAYKAFRYVREKGGIDTEESYPYIGKEGQCHFNQSSVGATAHGFVLIPSGDEGKLQSAVATGGPISVALNAYHKSFILSKKGIHFEPDCEAHNLNHEALVVGYGTEDGQGNWLVKNSWGTELGDNGYINMAKNKNNNWDR